MKIIQYLKETKAELKHVSWPTRNQTIQYTIIVIIISLLTAFYLGAFDSFFTNILSNLV